MPKDDEDHKDAGINRVLEASQLTKVLLSLFDALRERKFSKEDAIEIAQTTLNNFMLYKTALDQQEEEDNSEGFIILHPEDPNNPPNCSHH